MPSVLSRLYLIRHGETAWSLSGQHTGRTDIPLTEQGELDARKLAAGLRTVRFSRVFSNPLQRARRTAELAKLGDVAEIEPDLTEGYGDYEGQHARDGQIGISFERMSARRIARASLRTRRSVAFSTSHVGGKYCSLLAWSHRARPGRASDRFTGGSSAAFPSKHFVT
jgi:hypothetical protein